jgi:putative transcriptional regulator
MTAKKKYKSDAFEAIHSLASGLHKVGAISKTTMRSFDIDCIAPAPALKPAEIRSIRERNKLSQPVFANYLNVSKSTVEKWESGDKHPSGIAMRLLNAVNRHGLEILK